jgi:hypothetical protein
MFKIQEIDEMSNEDDAEKFDEENPIVWKIYCKVAFEGINAGMTHLGSRNIWEVMRFRYRLQTTEKMRNPDDPTKPLKLNNNYCAYYSRKFERVFPRHKGIFSMRETKAEREARESGEWDMFA